MRVIFWLWLGWNIIVFCVCGADKRRAQKNKWRISEKTLLFMAALCGAAGLWAGMYVFRHKTRHAAFRFGVPALLAAQLLAAGAAVWLVTY